MNSRIRKEIMPGVFLTYVPDNRFKTSYFSINLLRPLQKEYASRNNLLPRVLSRGTEQFPDMVQIAARLDELYGARLDPIVRKKGEVQCVGFASTFIDDRFISDKDLLENVINLVGQVLLSPATVGGRFNNDYVVSERENLIDDIRSVINDKKRLCLYELIKSMCSTEPFGVSNMGTESTAKAITGGKLFKHYSNIMGTSLIEIFYCGSAEFNRVLGALEWALSAIPQGNKVPVWTTRGYGPAEEKYLSSETDGKQSNIAIGFRIPVTINDENYPSAVLMNSIFGGSANSKLFMNVREKLSLCYYANSTYFKHKGIIIVSSGIDKDNYDRALDEIISQLDSVKKGEIEDWEFESSKQGIIGSLRNTMDSPGLMEDFYLSRAIEGLDYEPEFLIKKIDQLKKEDIIDIAQQMKTDTVYFLKGIDG